MYSCRVSSRRLHCQFYKTAFMLWFKAFAPIEKAAINFIMLPAPLGNIQTTLVPGSNFMSPFLL
jgi:hypothetical protein